MTFLERTTDARRYRHWEGNVEADYIYTSGVAGERFFVALRDEGRILAAHCPACGRDYLPARLFCEDCFEELSEFVEVPREGRVAAVTVAHLDRTGLRHVPGNSRRSGAPLARPARPGSNRHGGSSEAQAEGDPGRRDHGHRGV